MPIKVGDPTSLYTELFGWFYYGVVMDVLMASGLVFLPLFVIVAGHLYSAREQNSSIDGNADSVLAGLEMKMFMTLLVIAIAVMPSITIDASSFSYTSKSSVYRASVVNMTQGETDSTLDQAVKAPWAGNTEVQIPPFWYLVSQISHGITYAVGQAVDERGKAFNGIKRAMDIAQVRNPSIQQMLNRFNNECYVRALAHYDIAIRVEDVFAVPFLSVAGNPYVGANISRMSDPLWFTDGYYPNFRTMYPVSGFAYNPAVDVAESSPAQWGRPTCEQFYQHIATEIRKDPNFAISLNYMQEAVSALGTITGTVTEDELLLERYINSAQVGYQTPADKAVSTRSADINSGMKAALDVAGMTTFFTTGLGSEVFIDATIYALHQLRSMLMIVVLMALPIGLVVSMYGPGFLLQASMVFFALVFIPALWSIAAWAESTLAVSLFPTTVELVGMFEGGTSGDPLAGGISQLKKRLALNAATLLFYTVLPIGFMWILTAAGARVASQVGHISGHGLSAGQGQLRKPRLKK